MTQHRKRNKNLGLAELVAIALGGMVGGGIFTILGVSVSMIGNLTPIAIIIGGVLILYYEFTTKWEQMILIISLYMLLAVGAWKYSKNKNETNIKRA